MDTHKYVTVHIDNELLGGVYNTSTDVASGFWQKLAWGTASLLKSQSQQWRRQVSDEQNKRKWEETLWESTWKQKSNLELDREKMHPFSGIDQK